MVPPKNVEYVFGVALLVLSNETNDHSVRLHRPARGIEFAVTGKSEDVGLTRYVGDIAGA